ncbi:MAG: heparan-alpha-glucosaminide N-acetyltransferase domain-containing protein [Candidatus Omnitrophota bacterium]
MNEAQIQNNYPKGRLVSLDAFRGFTMMSMVLVNNAGDWEHIYSPLEHAKWNGCTFTDLIFPFFLFIVGVSMSFSFAKRLQSGGDNSPLIRQLIRRSLIIFALGLFLNALGNFDLHTIRIPGVLQRIAICYFAVGWIVIGLSPFWQWMSAFALLSVYWIGMLFIPVPGYGAGVIEPVGNFCWWIDNHTLGGHTWPNAPAAGFDPEGVFSTLPAIVTTLLGYFAGTWLRSHQEEKSRLIGLFLSGDACLLLGYILTAWMPFNKNLWTVPYVFLTAGLALHLLAFFYLIIDVFGYRKWAVPFLVFGSNAIFVYVLSSIGGELLGMISIGQGEARMDAISWIVQNLFAPWTSPVNASLLYAIAFVLFWLGATSILYCKRIFIKI